MNNILFRAPVRQPRHQRGVSLVEAMVALVVIAVGMLSLAQVQSQLRLNADLSRQRAEAVRFAQEDMENWRAFSQLSSAVGAVAYNDIASQASTAVAGQTNTNTTFNLTRTVTTSTDPSYKTLKVTVTWVGRNGEDQSVAIDSLISRTDPTLATQLSIPPSGSPIRNPLNRNVRIPTSAIDLGGNKAGFTPPGGTGYYVFNSSDASIIERCTGTLSQLSYEAIKDGTDLTNSCTPRPGYLVSGFINFDLRNNVSAISPGSTVCDFYQDLGNLIAAATPTLNVASVVLDRGSVAAASTTDKEYYINVVTVSNSSALVNGQANVSQSADLVVALTTSTVNNANAAKFLTTSPIVLRIKGGANVESFTPITSGAAQTVSRSGGGANYTALSNSTLALTINPTANLSANTVYELVIPAGVIRLSKNSNTDTNNAITLTFSTGTGPSLNSTSPADDGTMAAVSDNITMSFDRDVVGSVGNVVLLKRSNGNNFNPVETFDTATGNSGGGGMITFSGSTVTLNPGTDLLAGSDYAIQIQGGAIKDSNGINYAGFLDNTTFNFATPAAVVVGSCPTSGTVKPYIGVQLDLSDTGSGVPYSNPASECFTDAATAAVSSTTATVGYFCAVYAHDHDSNLATRIQWSGVLKVLGPTGWLTGNDSNYKVCRYHDPDGNGTDATYFEHPAAYGAVNESITDQNFLVIHKNRSCPNDTLNVGSQTGVVVYFSTAQLQP